MKIAIKINFQMHESNQERSLLAVILQESPHFGGIFFGFDYLLFDKVESFDHLAFAHATFRFLALVFENLDVLFQLFHPISCFLTAIDVSDQNVIPFSMVPFIKFCFDLIKKLPQLLLLSLYFLELIVAANLVQEIKMVQVR